MPQFVRYLAVGLFCAGLEYSSFLLLHGALGWGLVWANTLAYSLGLVSSFLINKFFVFTAPQQSKAHFQFAAYCLLALCNYLLGTWLLVYLVQRIQLPPWQAKALAMGAVATWNFFIYKKVIYR